jgi:hypothetical protein
MLPGLLGGIGAQAIAQEQQPTDQRHLIQTGVIQKAPQALEPPMQGLLRAGKGAGELTQTQTGPFEERHREVG